MQNVEEVGYVYKRVKRGRRRKSFDFERKPAVKLPAANGAVLLHPLPAALPAGPALITVTLAEGVTVQLVAEPNSRPQEPCAPRNDGSAQCSPLIVGMGKPARIGAEF